MVVDKPGTGEFWWATANETGKFRPGTGEFWWATANETGKFRPGTGEFWWATANETGKFWWTSVTVGQNFHLASATDG
ncbi:hypothetical protein KY290_023886 [Solanum tuberosum]|uniref:Uncharacterized protein n=1 Tax=Solanum tuberosum TaxID=4113 RepID=A0ABQ7UP51_SOLTU|nr:hypothetical protein KY290_023886 [Solanum tuberosum]